MGRPRKNQDEPKRIGRPPKNPADPNAAPKRRGRPPKLPIPEPGMYESKTPVESAPDKPKRKYTKRVNVVKAEEAVAKTEKPKRKYTKRIKQETNEITPKCAHAKRGRKPKSIIRPSLPGEFTAPNQMCSCTPSKSLNLTPVDKNLLGKSVTITYLKPVKAKGVLTTFTNDGATLSHKKDKKSLSEFVPMHNLQELVCLETKAKILPEVAELPTPKPPQVETPPLLPPQIKYDDEEND